MFHRISMDDISLHSGVPKQFSYFKNKKFNEWEIPPWELYIDSNKFKQKLTFHRLLQRHSLRMQRTRSRSFFRLSIRSIR